MPQALPRLRTSRCLVFLFKQGQLIGFDFLTKNAFCCSPAVLSLLQNLDDWTEKPDIRALVPSLSPPQASKLIDKLLDLSVLTAEGSAKADREDQLQRSWEWGLGTSLLHFGVQDAGSYVSLDEAKQWRVARAVHDPSPPLYCRHDCGNRAMKLNCSDDSLLALFAKRRTNRTPLPRAIDVQALADCLRAGLGITGFADTETGPLPLAMTPSGGARNPFEAYVYAKKVDGLACGFYHYSALEHSLQPLIHEGRPGISYLLGDQDWADAMPCVVFLIAYFERTMWKYRDDNGYRVVLIEAGHIAQNIMLMATARNMTACPTALLRHSDIHNCLNITHITRNVLYALTLSYPDETADSKIP